MTIAAEPAGAAFHINARRGRGAAVIAAVREAFAIELPQTPRVVEAGDCAAVWSGPGQWLLMAADGRQAAIAGKAGPLLTGLAAVTDQSDSRVHIRLGGSAVREALAKLVGIDLHPAVFPAGTAAMTGIAHIPVHIWRREDAGGQPVFVIAGPQSYARSLWHHVIAASEEYGCVAQPA